jgi:hypothetical protein
MADRYDTAYLRIDDGTGTTATFELNIALEETTEIQKSYIMANRGQFIQEIADNSVVDLGVDAVSQRRAGYTIDGGAGEQTFQVLFEAGLADVIWGDENSGTGPSNVTKTDATGADVKALDRKQVMAYWIRRTRTDSFGQARLHWGQWTDGNVPGYSAGVYEEPIPVSILNANLDGPPTDDSSVFTGTLEFQRVALFPTDAIPDWIANPAEKIADQITGVSDR